MFIVFTMGNSCVGCVDPLWVRFSLVHCGCVFILSLSDSSLGVLFYAVDAGFLGRLVVIGHFVQWPFQAYYAVPHLTVSHFVFFTYWQSFL